MRLQISELMYQYSNKDTTEDRLDYVRMFPTAIIVDGKYPTVKRGGRSGITINNDSCRIRNGGSLFVSHSHTESGYYCDSKEYYGDMTVNCASIKSTGDLFQSMYKSRI